MLRGVHHTPADYLHLAELCEAEADVFRQNALRRLAHARTQLEPVRAASVGFEGTEHVAIAGMMLTLVSRLNKRAGRHRQRAMGRR